MNSGPILHINAETTWRGGENQVFQLAKGMRSVLPTVVACMPGSPLDQRLIDAGVTTSPLPGDRGVRALLALRRTIRDLRPRLLHAHTSRAHQLCLLASPRGRIPIVVTRRVDFPLKRGPLARWKYGSRIARFVAISQAIQQILIAGHVPADRIAIIPSGIDGERIDSLPPSDPRVVIGAPADADIVLNVAALTDHKDHDTLLRAWALVEPTRPRSHLVIAGEGELRESLLALARSLGLHRAHFIGHRNDVIGLMKRSDCFVMSSHLEGLCTSIMDAKRCHLPVVATRAGGIPEVVRDGIDGILVPVRDPTELAQALCVYLDDPGRRGRDGAAARSDSARFSAEAMVDAYLKLYGGIIGDPPC